MARAYKTGRAQASTPYETYKKWYEKYSRNNEMNSPLLNRKEFFRGLAQEKQAGAANPSKAVAMAQKEASDLKAGVWATQFKEMNIPEHLFDAEFGEGAYKKYTVDGKIKKSFIKQNAKQFMNWADDYFGDALDAILSP